MNQRRRKKLTRRLFAAIREGDTTAVQPLLRAGIDPNRPDSGGTTPLYEASVNGQPETARLLLLAGATPNAESTGPGADGTPLCAATSWGHTETVRTLLTHGADPNLPEDDGTGWTPLKWAHHGPHPETADLLIASGAAPVTDADA